MWRDAESLLKKDKYLGMIVVKTGSCRIRKSERGEYFDDLAASIIEQQLSGKAAKAIYERVKRGVVGDLKMLLNPEAILKKSDEELRSFGISWGKVKYLKDLSDKVDRGELNLDSLEKLTDEEIIEELIKVRGIGRWTAEMFLMFTLARPDIFPVDDLGIQKGYLKVTGKKFDKVKSARLADKYWKPYRTVASWYIWRSLEGD